MPKAQMRKAAPTIFHTKSGTCLHIRQLRGVRRRSVGGVHKHKVIHLSPRGPRRHSTQRNDAHHRWSYPVPPEPHRPIHHTSGPIVLEPGSPPPPCLPPLLEQPPLPPPPPPPPPVPPPPFLAALWGTRAREFARGGRRGGRQGARTRRSRVRRSPRVG